MSFARLVYTLFCIAVLSGLAYANVRGYVPLAVNAKSAKHAATNTASRFHK